MACLRHGPCVAAATHTQPLCSPALPRPLPAPQHLVVEEIGGVNCCVLRQDASLGSIATVVLRGSTEGMLDDVERAVNDGVNAFKALAKDARVVPAGGASEIEIARQCVRPPCMLCCLRLLLIVACDCLP